ncbi:class I SAM-dependent DNA methyltransferase [Lentibacillus salinarum]|uniref:Class I SAM-dependent DNA methyltransferase n=1 Tax=Lentibacillus salinarum TaxID=446820 RepID=A0ABW3ZXU0_9BACI
MTYEQMARYYDQLMADAPYDEWICFTEQVISQSGKQIESVVDLGCGTGQITTKLAQSGYRMTGVDYSSEMLSVAEQHASSKHVPVHWIQQDLRELAGVENQDMAISYCDVMNYITGEDDIRTVFANAAVALKPGGLFIFDVHSLYHVETHLLNQTFSVVSDDVSYIWFCLEGEDVGDMYHDLTFFVRDQNQYTRFDEWHHQKTYATDFYTHLLNDTGFDIRHISADFSLQPDYDLEEAERIFITAVKRSE